MHVVFPVLDQCPLLALGRPGLPNAAVLGKQGEGIQASRWGCWSDLVGPHVGIHVTDDDGSLSHR